MQIIRIFVSGNPLRSIPETTDLENRIFKNFFVSGMERSGFPETTDLENRIFR